MSLSACLNSGIIKDESHNITVYSLNYVLNYLTLVPGTHLVTRSIICVWYLGWCSYSEPSTAIVTSVRLICLRRTTIAVREH